MSAGVKVLRPWDVWFAGLDSDESLRAKVTLRAEQGLSLVGKSPTIACDELRSAWKQIYLPCNQHLGVLRKLVDRARGNASHRFSCVKTYEDAIYARSPLLTVEPEIWGLTGLAGVGKSSLILALDRALQPPEGFCLTPSVPACSRPVVPLILTAERSSQAVLCRLANPVFVGGRTNISPSGLVQHLREWLFAQGTLLVPVDELQSLTRSEGATTLIANLLTELNELGPYLVYCFNYSLGHKLLKRPQEDKDRLFANCLLLDVPSLGESNWRDVIAEYVRVAPGHFELVPDRDGPELYRLTGGLYRLLRILLLESCRQAWPSSVTRRVSMAEVRRAFQSTAFTSQRADVEALQSINFSARERARHRGLVCPFTDASLSPGGAVEGKPISGPRAATTLTVPAAAAKHVVESALTLEEKGVLAALRCAAGQAASTGRKAATVTRLPRSGPISAEALMAGADLLSPARAKDRSVHKDPGGATEEQG
jgi:energy-coupling factor transporter ATP-binding protein EcfA2